MKVVIDDKIPFIKGVLEPYSDVVYIPGHLISKNDLLDADALIIRTRTYCNKELLEGTSVKILLTATIGYDHIDTDYCQNAGIIWKNMPGCNSGSVMQYIGGTLNSLQKKHGFRFEDKCIGIVGVGNVGKKVGKLCESLGMRVMLCDPPRVEKEGICGYISMEGIFRECDIISLHVPLIEIGNHPSLHLINQESIKKINRGSILINTSRGEVVESEAAKEALKKGILSDIAFDVWENEPNIDKELVNLAHIATPHIAGYSADGKANGTKGCIHAIAAYFRLPLKNWEPNDIPKKQEMTITIDEAEKSSAAIISEAISFTYSIDEDNAILKKQIEDFELYRGAYPLRREYQAYTIQHNITKVSTISDLRKLGFKTTNI